MTEVSGRTFTLLVFGNLSIKSDYTWVEYSHFRTHHVVGVLLRILSARQGRVVFRDLNHVTD